MPELGERPEAVSHVRRREEMRGLDDPRAKNQRIKMFPGPSPESKGRYAALTVLCVPIRAVGPPGLGQQAEFWLVYMPEFGEGVCA